MSEQRVPTHAGLGINDTDRAFFHSPQHAAPQTLGYRPGDEMVTGLNRVIKQSSEEKLLKHPKSQAKAGTIYRRLVAAGGAFSLTVLGGILLAKSFQSQSELTQQNPTIINTPLNTPTGEGLQFGTQKAEASPKIIIPSSAIPRASRSTAEVNPAPSSIESSQPISTPTPTNGGEIGGTPTPPPPTQEPSPGATN